MSYLDEIELSERVWKAEEMHEIQIESKSHTSTPQMIQHLVLPSDTFEGVCLRYKVSGNRLRQCNQLLGGTNLRIMPPILHVPVSSIHSIKHQDTTTIEYKVSWMVYCVPQLTRKVAEAYLKICDMDLSQAISKAKDDFEWEKSHEALMVERILSLRDPVMSKSSNSHRRCRLQNFCIHSFNRFLLNHGVTLTKTTEEEMWFEMTVGATPPPRSPSLASLTDDSSCDSNYGEYQYSVQYDFSLHRLSTRPLAPQLVMVEAAMQVQHKLLEILSMFQPNQNIDMMTPFFEMTDLRHGKEKLA